MITPNQYAGLRALGILVVVAAVAGVGFWHHNKGSNGADVHRFAKVTGPLEKSVVPPEGATPWTQFDHGSNNSNGGRLAILLTGTDSEWLSLAQGLVRLLFTRVQ